MTIGDSYHQRICKDYGYVNYYLYSKIIKAEPLLPSSPTNDVVME